MLIIRHLQGGGDFTYANPLLCLNESNNKLIMKRNIKTVNIDLVPEIAYEDDYIINYKFYSNDNDSSILSEIFCIITPFFQLNEDEKELANEIDGHLAKHINREISIFKLYINGVLVNNFSRYFQYDNYNYITPTYINNYFEINDIDDNLIKKLCELTSYNYENISDVIMRFLKGSWFIDITFNKNI